MKFGVEEHHFMIWWYIPKSRNTGLHIYLEGHAKEEWWKSGRDPTLKIAESAKEIPGKGQ